MFARRPTHRSTDILKLFGLCFALLLASAPMAWAGPRAASEVSWLSLRTKHFIIHYPVSRAGSQDPHVVNGARVAQRAADASEALYDKYTAFLKVSLSAPVHLILEEQAYDGEGLAEPEWLRITVPTQPGPTWLLRGQGDWLKESIAHELAHLMLVYAGSPVAPGVGAQLEARIGDRSWLSRTVGSPLSSNPELQLGAKLSFTDPAPFYWAEGGAEFLADVAGANHWDAARDMLLRTSMLEHLVLPPTGWESSIGKTGLDGERVYNQGYSFLLFMRERYGEESFARVLTAARGRFRFDWNDAFEAGQGIGFSELYGRWKSWLEDRYQKASALRSNEVAGDELILTVPLWRSPDLETRRRWLAQPVGARRAEREGEGATAMFPTWSKDGHYLASWENGLVVRAVPEAQWPSFGGHPLESFRDRLELGRRLRRQGTLTDVRQYPVSWSPDGKRLVVVADENWRQQGVNGRSPYHWNALFLVDVSDPDKEGLTLTVAPPGTPIPNTLRARDPAWSPDGRWIAFVRYADGTANLWLVRPDGSEARALTQFSDGTDLGHPSWAPDSQHLVFSMFRRNQRDLWTLDLATQSVQPVMLDTASDLDPTWAPDGKIYYSSDASGTFNLFTYDPSTLEVRRITDAVGGVFSPELTPKGNLIFSYFDGYSFKLNGMLASKAVDVAVDNAAFFIDPSLTQGNLQGAQEAPAADGHPYRSLEGRPHIGMTPTLRVTDRDVSGGALFRWQDPLQRRAAQLEALAGLGTLLDFDLVDQSLGPEFRLSLIWRSLKESVTLAVEGEGASEEIERKHEQSFKAAYGSMQVPIAARFSLGLTLDVRSLNFREREDGADDRPLYGSFGGGPQLTYDHFPRDPDHSARGIDPRGGVRVQMRYALRQSRIWNPLTGEPGIEDGRVLGTYLYHRFDLEILQGLALPWRHTLEWRLNYGAVNRDVAWWDEVKAGYRLSSLEPQLDPIVSFSGYDVLSLSGETLGVLSVAYRIPLNTNLGRRVGPWYLDALYGQVGGSLGNVWGYREVTGGLQRERIGQSPVRNTPEGSGQVLLGEIGLEIRMQASLFNRYRWGSFVRLGYALNSVTGVGDVNRDGVYPGRYGDVSPQAAGELSPAGVRFSLGLGTGF